MKEKDAGFIHGQSAVDFAGEVLLFELLGKILYTFPDETWLDPILDEELYVEAPFAQKHDDVLQGLSLLREFSHQYKIGDRKGIIKDLKAEYTRLFDHTEKIPVAPWESVYLSKDHLLFQEQVLKVRNWYRTYNLAIINLHKEPDDHIGLELAFIAHLARLIVHAAKNNEKDELDRLLTAQRKFLNEHVLKWIPTWCDLMLVYAESDFYKGIVLVLRGALEELTAISRIEPPIGLVK